jgi:hypothetical protein
LVASPIPLLVLLPGCGEEPASPGDAPAASALALRAAAAAPPDTLSMHPDLSDCQVKALEPAFDSRFFADLAGTASIPRPAYTFTIASFQDLLLDARHCCDSSKVLLLRYGLDALGRLTYGLTVTCASEKSRAFPEPVLHWMPDSHGDLVPYSGATTWKAKFGDAYTATGAGAKVFVDADGQGIRPFDPAKDTRYTVFGIDRVLAFLQQNTDSSNARIATHVEVVSYAHLRQADFYHHGVMLVARDAQGRMLDDDQVADAEFYMKACDLGNPCPYQCARYMPSSRGFNVPGCRN